MNIDDEKKFIYEMMRDVAAERRRLTDIYYRMQERMQSLYKLEEVGHSDLDLRGYVDLHNRNNALLEAHMRSVDVRDIAKQARAEVEAGEAVEEQPEESKVPRVKQFDRRIGVRVKHKYPKRRKRSMTTEDATRYIVEILRDHGGEVTSGELYRLFLAKTDTDEDALTIRNFRSNVLRRAMNDEPAIKDRKQVTGREKLYRVERSAGVETE